MIKEILDALKGRGLWKRIKRKYRLAENGIYVIMLPDEERDFNEAALRHVDGFLEYHKGRAAVILTPDRWTADNAPRFSSRVMAAELITRRDCLYYTRYYYYQGFSVRFVIVSLRDSSGRRLRLADNINGVTKEDLVCLGLYVIRNWGEPGVPSGQQ